MQVSSKPVKCVRPLKDLYGDGLRMLFNSLLEDSLPTRYSVVCEICSHADADMHVFKQVISISYY